MIRDVHLHGMNQGSYCSGAVVIISSASGLFLGYYYCVDIIAGIFFYLIVKSGQNILDNRF